MKRFFLCGVLLISSPLLAAEIEGVQPAAMDQPRIHMHLRRGASGKPLMAGDAKEHTINIQAFLDTGASGVMLSTKTADALGVKREDYQRQRIIFHDVGVGGSDEFHVSENLYLFIAPWGKNGEPDDQTGYPLSYGPVRAQIGPLNGGLIEVLTGGLDVVGMPAIKGNVIIIDPKSSDHFDDTLRTSLIRKRGDNRAIPPTDRHVPVRYQSFERFTKVEPNGARGPTLSDNPFIDNLIVKHGKGQAKVSWLLDTGAAASMISTKVAAALGVQYVEGSEMTDTPKLHGVPEKDQFALTIGGVGGSKKSAGFFLDSLSLPTREKDPIVYKRAPVFVTDITVEDPKTHEKMTLDGVFGMNFLVASAMVKEAAMIPDVNNMTVGPYEWIVFDEPAALLGLKLKKQLR